MRPNKFWCSCLTLYLLMSVCQAVEAAKKVDHPLISRYPNTQIHSQWIDEYTEYNIPTKAYVEKNVLAGKITKKGKVTHTLYKGDASISGLRAHENFVSSLSKDNFELIFQCIGTACGNGRFIDDLHGGSHKMMWVNERGSSSDAEKYFSVIAAKKSEGDKEYFVVLYINNRFSRGGFKMLLDILETEDVGDGLVTVSTDFDDIEKSGKAVLGGLYFDTGKATLLDSSNDSLTDISAYLNERPTQTFLVVGHTDTVGSYESNLDLSKKRADAVIAALVERFTVRADQLIGVGASYAAPVASNRAENGRSLNRRVELVEKP